MADQFDEPMDLTDLPLLSRSNVLTEAQDAAAFTSATPFVEPPTIAAPKSKAQKQLTRLNDLQTGTQRQLTDQQHQTSAAEPAQISVQLGTSSDQIELQQAQSTWNTKWASSIMRFKTTFLDNDFGYPCLVCDRLWFKNDLKPITAAQMKVILKWMIKENRRLCREEFEMVCTTCKRSLDQNRCRP